MSQKVGLIVSFDLPYRQGLQLQIALHQRIVASEELTGVILVTSHDPPVITLGRRETGSNVLTSEEQLQRQNIETIKIERGGTATLHSPGQLVVYPILSLERIRMTLRNFVEFLEDVVIAVLDRYRLKSGRNPEIPIGIWYKGKKICSIGLALKHGVVFHGIALNVNNDLRLFNHIYPCSISTGDIMTSLAVHCSPPPSLETVSSIFIEIFCRKLNLEAIILPQEVYGFPVSPCC